MDITFFGRSAEVTKQYLHKGSKILVEGRLVFDQWVDQNGQKKSKHSVAVEIMQMLDSKNDNRTNDTIYSQSIGTSGSDYTYPRSQNDSTYPPKTNGTKQDKPQTYSPKSQQTPPPIDLEEETIPF